MDVGQTVLALLASREQAFQGEDPISRAYLLALEHVRRDVEAVIKTEQHAKDLARNQTGGFA